MNIGNTQMHATTLAVISIELILLGVQLLLWLNRPKDTPRLWYVLLLAQLILFNITNSLFPDPQYTIPVFVQHIIANGSGFLLAAYFPWYFYKAFGLKLLRFHALYGVPLFPLLPYLGFFVVAYSIHGDWEFTVRYGLVIPFLYFLLLLAAILKAIRAAYKDSRNRHEYIREAVLYCAVAPWAALAPVVYFNAGQFTEILLANTGFLAVSVLFTLRSVKQAQAEVRLIDGLQLVTSDPEVVKRYSRTFGLSAREIDVVLLLCQQHTRQQIADKLFISMRTVDKHLENVFVKVDVKCKADLIRRLNGM